MKILQCKWRVFDWMITLRRPGLMIHPHTPFCQVKDIFFILLVIYSSSWEPFVAAFEEGEFRTNHDIIGLIRLLTMMDLILNRWRVPVWFWFVRRHLLLGWYRHQFLHRLRENLWRTANFDWNGCFFNRKQCQKCGNCNQSSQCLLTLSNTCTHFWCVNSLEH